MAQALPSQQYGRLRLGVAVLGRICLAAVVVLLVASGCSGDDDDPEGAAGVEPCDLLTEADASSLLGVEVEYIDFVDLFERENGPVPSDELPAVEAAGEKMCSYAEVDGEAVVALQLDRVLFSSADEFRSAWEDDVEILAAPGLAASFDAEGQEHSGAVSVLLNDQGDSFALTTYRAEVGRDELLEAASESTERYSS